MVAGRARRVPHASGVFTRPGLDRPVERFPRGFGGICTNGGLGRDLALLPGLPRAQRHHAEVGRAAPARRPARRRDAGRAHLHQARSRDGLYAMPDPGGGPVQDVIPCPRRPILILLLLQLIQLYLFLDPVL